MDTQSYRSHPWQRFILLVLSSAATTTLLLLLLLTNGAHGEPAVPDASGSIHGQVLDETGKPLSDNIYVDLYTYPFQITDTNGFLRQNRIQSSPPDAAGFYSFTSLPSGVYRVEFYEIGDISCGFGACSACLTCGDHITQFYSNTLHFATAQDIVVMGSTITGIDATLQRGGVLTGTVTLGNAVDHTLDGQITLYRATPDGWQASRVIDLPSSSTVNLISEPSEFRFAGLAPGIYRLCATLRHDYLYASSEDVLLWTGCYQQPNAIGQALPGGVDDLFTLEPITSATDISVSGAITLTNLNFVVAPFLPDPLPDAPGIRGTVTNSDNSPLPGIRVTAYLSQSTTSGNRLFYASTNQYGDYRLPLTTGGEYILNFSESAVLYNAPHYIDSYYPNSKTFDTATPLSWQPGQRLQNIDLILYRWPKITGTVQIKGGYAAEAALINIYRKSDSGGTFEKTLYSNRSCVQFCARSYRWTVDGYQVLLEPGTYRLAATVRIDGQNLITYYGGSTLEQATDLVIQPEEQRSDINVTLDAEQFETSLGGKVMAEGVPRSGVRVELYNYGEVSPFGYVTSGTDGEYTVSGLLAGKYLVRALAPEPKYAAFFYGEQPVNWAAQPITISPDAPGKQIDLSLPHAAALDGSLRRFDGQPLAGATVWVHWYTGDDTWERQSPAAGTLTDAQGNWTVQGLLPGVYRVRFQHPDFWPQSIPYGTLNGSTGIYTPSDLKILPDVVTHTTMVIDPGYLRTPTTLGESAEPQRLFIPLVTR